MANREADRVIGLLWSVLDISASSCRSIARLLAENARSGSK
jgi:hypothetical protein